MYSVGGHAPFHESFSIIMILRKRALEHENARGITLLVISSLALLFSSLAVICRLLARRIKRTPLALDDLFIIVALVRCFAYQWLYLRLMIICRLEVMAMVLLRLLVRAVTTNAHVMPTDEC